MEQPISNNGKIIRIAIAEDHKMMRDMLVANINSMKNCEVVFTAANGQELLDALDKLGVKPDICILDINMPILNGYDTQKVIKKRWPEMKTLALSIFEDPICEAEMLKHGANGYVSKNSGIKVLEEAIFSVYEYGMYPVKAVLEDLLPQPGGLPALTETEKQYLTLTCTEMSMDEIAQKMCINMQTLEHTEKSVLQKINVNDKADLLFYVNKTGIVFMG